MRLVVFTDLDGTLLDHRTYSHQAARPALDELRRRRIPVVLCSSKTRTEILPLREELGLLDPFVAENGGGIYVPRNYFPFPLSAARKEADYLVLELGAPYQKLVRALDEAAKTSGVRVRGFNRMTEKEVAKLCGLSATAARRARQREYDEPFLLEKGTPQQEQRFFGWVQQRGLRWRQGGRFLHLMGDNDKGVAVSRLAELYRQHYTAIRTLGLGDSPNDLDFLAAVDLPVLVAGPDGGYDAEVRRKLPRVRLARGVGPGGWNQAVTEILADHS
ncbi:MAG: mannosyl-3-phosphoglycerate phosphatase [Acidobacteria bacterium]|nr:mannosyl-3-phosphoglycerate phosphatase [Acidobacteriota bacterium]